MANSERRNNGEAGSRSGAEPSEEYIIRTLGTVKVRCRLFGGESFSLTGVRFRSAALRETTVRARRGFRNQVDNHWGRILSALCLPPLFAAGIELSQGTNSSVLQTQSVGQQIGQRVGQQVGQLGTDVTRRNLNVQPTLVVLPGYRFFVRVEKDILFNGPYSPMTAEGESGRSLGREAIGGQEENDGREGGREETSQGQPRGAAVDGRPPRNDPPPSD